MCTVALSVFSTLGWTVRLVLPLTLLPEYRRNVLVEDLVLLCQWRFSLNNKNVKAEAE